MMGYVWQCRRRGGSKRRESGSTRSEYGEGFSTEFGDARNYIGICMWEYVVPQLGKEIPPNRVR